MITQAAPIAPLCIDLEEFETVLNFRARLRSYACHSWALQMSYLNQTTRMVGGTYHWADWCRRGMGKTCFPSVWRLVLSRTCLLPICNMVRAVRYIEQLREPNNFGETQRNEMEPTPDLSHLSKRDYDRVYEPAGMNALAFFFFLLIWNFYPRGHIFTSWRFGTRCRCFKSGKTEDMSWDWVTFDSNFRGPWLIFF